jgi:glutathione synthase
MQAELTKPEVLRRYISDEEAKELESTYVKIWEFDTMTEEGYKELIDLIKQKPEAYMLKPNLEGGGNNFFGQDALNKLQTLSRDEARIYIVMEKIFTKGISNSIINAKGFTEVICEY